MKRFRYTAYADELQEEGELNAHTKLEAAKFLREQGLRPAHIEELSVNPVKKMLKRLKPSPVTMEHGVLFCRQLALLCDTGHFQFFLGELAKSEKDKVMRDLAQGVLLEMETGHRLWEAMQKYENVFSPGIIHLIAAGEKSGNLKTVLESAADYLEKSYNSRQKLISALFYPAILCLAIVVAISVMVVFVLPRFQSLFDGMNMELPFVTRALLSFGNTAREYWPLLLASLLGGCLPIILISSQKKVNLLIHRVRLKIPLLGKLEAELAWLRILNALSLLLATGIRMDEALELAGKTAGNAYLEQSLAKGRIALIQGASLSEALASGKPSSALISLVAAGEKAGMTEEMLAKGAEYFNFHAQMHRERLLTMVEPLLILFLGAVMILVVFSVIMPILDTIDALSVG